MTGVEGYGYVRPTQLTLYTYDNDADKGQIHITTKYSGQ
jgi:hypothetical protein